MLIILVELYNISALYVIIDDYEIQGGSLLQFYNLQKMFEHYNF